MIKKVLLAFLFITGGYAQESNPDPEIQIYQQLLKEDPNNVEYLSRLGHLYLLQHELGKARTVLEKAERLNRYDMHVHLMLGQLDYWEGRYVEAENQLKIVLAYQPNNVEAVVLSGQILMALGKEDQARDQFEKAIVLDPLNLIAKSGLEEIQMLKWKRAEPETYQQALSLEREEEFKQAIKVYSHLVRIDPENAEYQYRLGWLYAREHEYLLGKKYLEKANELNPKNQEILIALVHLYFWSGDLKRAEDSVEELLEINPKNGEGLIAAGYIALANGDIDDAEEYFKQALPRVEAREGLEEVAEWDERDLWEFPDERALRYANEGRIKRAIAMYQSVLLEDPNNVEALYQIGKLYAQQGQWDDAREYLEKALIEKPDHEDVQIELANVDYRERNYEAARLRLLEVLEESPDNIDALIAMGHLEYTLERNDEAVEYFTRALVLNPNQQEAAVGLLRIEGTTIPSFVSRKTRLFFEARSLELASRYDEAERVYMVIMAEDPGNWDVIYRLGRLYTWMEKFDPAMEYLKQAMKEKPRDQDAKIAYAYLLYRMGNYDDAAAFINKVIKRHPGNIDALVAGGLIETALHNDDQAKKYFKKVIALDYDMQEGHIGLGRIAEKRKEFHKAFNYFEQAYSLNPYNYAGFNGLSLTRPYVNPTIYTKGAYSQERENDLITRERTTQMNTTYGTMGLIVPASDHFRAITSFDYMGTEQMNLIQKVDTYMVNSYLWTFGGETIFKRYWTFIGKSIIKWSRGSAKTLLPFESKTSWEPAAMLRFSSHYCFASATAYMDSLIGRNFNDDRAFMIERKNVSATFIARYYPPFGNSGVTARNSNYNDSFNNHERDVEIWMQLPAIEFGGHWYFRYLWNWGSFKEVNPDYNSYRYRARHDIQFFYLLRREPSCQIELSYTRSWAKERELTNIATFPVNPLTGQPQEILKNIYNAHAVKALIRKVFETHVLVELSTEFYTDSNRYHYWDGVGHIRWVF